MGRVRTSNDSEPPSSSYEYPYCRLTMKTARVLLVLALAIQALPQFVVVPISGVRVINVPGDHATIQSALNAAGPGDTIVVEPGNYRETLSVNLPVVIEGRNRETTILNATGGGPAIRIEATGVRVSNLTITNVGSSWDGILIQNSSNVTISRVNILLARQGLYSNGTQILSSQNVLVTETMISGADLWGIATDKGGKHLFAGNYLTNNLNGIGVFRGSETVLVDNRLRGPGEVGVQVGDLKAGSSGTVVAYNAIDDFTISGIDMFDSYDNILQENVITRIEDPSPAGFAAAISLQNSTGNAIFLNDLVSNPDLYAQGVFPQDRTGNVWNSYDGLGNHWGNYQGLDDGSVDPRTGQPRTRGDGVGDTELPHIFDYYPLMQPWNSTPRTAVASLRVIVLNQDGNPVSGATVSSTMQPMGQASLRATSNGGRMTFYGIMGGGYTLSVSAPGYETMSRVVSLVPRTMQVETLTLSRAASSGLLAIVPYLATGLAVALGLLGFFLFRRRRAGLARRSTGC